MSLTSLTFALALEAVKVVAAVSTLAFPRNEHLAELAEELAVV